MPTATRHAKRPKSKARVVIREITSADDPLLDDAYDLLSGSFEKHELVSVLEWRDTLAEKDAQVWSDISWHLLVAARGRRVLGVATGTYLGNLNVGAIGYLVVHPDARGLGLGPRLRGRLKQSFRRDAARINETELAGVVGEVRQDNPWLHRLVQREDVIALDFPYYQPSLRSGESPVPFVFYYEGVGDIRKTLKAKELSQLLYTIWRRIYRVARPMTSATFRRMVGNLAGRRLVGEIALEGSAGSR